MIFAIIKLIVTIGKLCFAAYFGYKFLSGDKCKRETVWYGIATALFII